MIIKALVGYFVGTIVAIIIVLLFNVQIPSICSGIGMICGMIGTGCGLLASV